MISKDVQIIIIVIIIVATVVIKKGKTHFSLTISAKIRPCRIIPYSVVMLIKELQRLQEEHLAETKVKNFRSVSASGTGQLADTN